MQYLPPPPHEYQYNGIKFLLKKAFAGLFWPPGLGKTRTVLEAVKILKKKKMVRKVLIVSKRRIIHQVWPKEIYKWDMPFECAIVHGTEKKRLEAMQSDAFVHLINFEGLLWLMQKRSRTGRKLKFETYLRQFDMLVIDESSQMKAYNSKRVKALNKALHFFKRRVILTGTPAANSLMGLFSQMYIVDRGESLGEFITSYRNRYFYPSGFKGYNYELQDGAKEKIYKAIEGRILRYSQKLLDMPDLVKVFHVVTLPEETREVYDAMEREAFAEMKGVKLTADTAATVTGKLRQMANGGVYYHEAPDILDLFITAKEKRKTLHLHNEKTLMLSEILEELQGSPAIVAYEYHHDLERLLEAYPDTPYIGTGVSDQRCAEIEDAWNAGELELLFAHPDSVAHGLNLQESGADVIFYSLTWNLENYIQFYSRVWRQGQESKEVRVHHIVTEDTVDEVVLHALDTKEETQEDLLNALEEYTMKREVPVVTPTDDAVRTFAGQVLTATKQRLPVYEASDSDKERRDANYARVTIQRISGWTIDEHLEYHRLAGTKITKTHSNKDALTLLNHTKKLVFKALRIDVVEKPGGIIESAVVTDEPWLAAQVGVDTLAKEDSTMTTKKSTVKKAAPKKRAAPAPKTRVSTKKKVAAKKAPVKKKVAASKKEDNSFAGTVKRGEGTPKLPVRQEILAMVPKGAKGVKAATLVGKMVEAGHSSTAARAMRTLQSMEKLGFVSIK